MHTRIYSTLLLSLVCTLSLLATDSLTTSISDIMLYRQGATIERSGTGSLTKGYNKVIITDLPMTIDRSTLNVYVSKDVSILSQRVYNSSEPTGMAKELLSQKRILQDSINWANMKIKILKDQNDLLNVNKELPEEVGEAVDLEVVNLHSKYGRLRLENEKKIIRLQEELRSMKDHMYKLENRINRIADSSKGQTQIELELQSNSSGEKTINIVYTHNSAGWTPSYDIMVADLSQDMRLIYKTSVYQNTGEDWKDAQVTLSSALPQQHYTVPKLYPYYLHDRQEIHHGQVRTKKQMDYTMASAEIQEVADEEAMGQYMPNNALSNQATSIEYRLAYPLTLASGEGQRTLLLQQKDIPAQYEYVAIPKARQYAMLIAKINDWAALELLDGQAQIYLEGRRVGRTYIKTSTDDSYTLSLGEDRKVRLKRELLKGYEKTKSWSGGKVDTREWKLTVLNLKNTPITISIKDQYPISQDSDIKVKLIKDGGASDDKVKGELSWQSEIGTNQSWTRIIKYEVKYPKDRHTYID